MYNLYAEHTARELERAIALRRAERFGVLGAPAPRSQRASARRRWPAPAARRRLAPMLRLMGLM